MDVLAPERLIRFRAARRREAAAALERIWVTESATVARA
jgi:hypothetical protein